MHAPLAHCTRGQSNLSQIFLGMHVKRRLKPSHRTMRDTAGGANFDTNADSVMISTRAAAVVTCSHCGMRGNASTIYVVQELPTIVIAANPAGYEVSVGLLPDGLLVCLRDG